MINIKYHRILIVLNEKKIQAYCSQKEVLYPFPAKVIIVTRFMNRNEMLFIAIFTSYFVSLPFFMLYLSQSSYS